MRCSFCIFVIALLLTSFFRWSLEAQSPDCERIVSLAPSITETLFTLDLNAQISGVTDFCNYPAEAKLKPRVGGYLNVGLESLIALKPTIVMHLKEQTEVALDLKKLGLKTLAINHSSVAGIFESFTEIGKSCAISERTQPLRESLETKVATIKQALKGAPVIRTLVVVGRRSASENIKNVYVSGSDGYYNDLLKLAGAENVYSGTTVSIPSISAESLLKLNPQAIIEIVFTPDYQTQNSNDILRAWREFPELEAVQNKRIYAFASDFMSIPGPRFVEALERLAKVLHPERKLN